MFRNLIQLYSMAICFTASIIGMITFGLAINSITDLAFLDSKIHYTPTSQVTSTPQVELTPEAKEADKQNFYANKKASALSNLYNEIGWLLNAGIFFLIHWNLYKRYRDDNVNSSV